MKIVFFGTPLLAAKVLHFLDSQDHEIIAVVTRPDKPKRRSNKLLPSPVKEAALSLNLSLYQPESTKDPIFIESLSDLKVDLFVVVAFGEILRQNILDLPKLGCINLHASLLPKYRGAAPIQRAIMEGEKETGVTIIRMVRKMDAGSMLGMVRFPILENDHAEKIEELIIAKGSLLLDEVIKKIEKKEIEEKVQDEEKVTFAPKIETEDCKINFEGSSYQAHNLIRAVSNHTGAFCFFVQNGEKKRVKIYQSLLHAEDFQKKPGNLTFSKDKLFVSFKKGSLEILELQLEGKKRMTAKEFLRGFPLNSLDFFE